MVNIVKLKRPRPRRSLSRVGLSPVVHAGIGTSVATSQAQGRFGAIGRSLGIATAVGDDNISRGIAAGATTVNGVINAAASIGRVVTTTQTIGFFNAASSNGIINGVTTAVGIPGFIGSVSAISSAVAT